MEDIKKVKEKLSTKLPKQNVIYLKECNSTQKYIKENAQKLPSKTVVICDNQTSGIGTNGRTWITKPNENLTFSYFIKPNSTNCKCNC